jgi:hypothetical protein
MSSPYESLFSSGFQLAKPNWNFLDQLDKQNRIKFDENGDPIKPKYRIPAKKFLNNPYGINAGNAINPFVPQGQNFLAGLQLDQTNPVTAALKPRTNDREMMKVAY